MHFGLKPFLVSCASYLLKFAGIAIFPLRTLDLYYQILHIIFMFSSM